MGQGDLGAFASSRAPVPGLEKAAGHSQGKEMGDPSLPPHLSPSGNSPHSRANACCNSQLHVPPPKWSMLNLQALAVSCLLPDLCLPLKYYIVAMNLKLQIFSDLPHKNASILPLWDGSSLDTLTHIECRQPHSGSKENLTTTSTTWSAVGQAGNTG